MKRLLIVRIRPVSKRAVRSDGDTLLDLPAEAFDPAGVVFIEKLLADIEVIEPRLRTMVELRVFHGKASNEIGAELGRSERILGTLWAFVQKWLATQLGEDEA